MKPLKLTRSPAYVYLIGAENRLYKIGCASSPESRLAQLQCGSPVPLRLCCSVSSVFADVVERRVHDRFKAVRRHNEWFALRPSDVKRFEDIARSEEVIVQREEAAAAEQWAERQRAAPRESLLRAVAHLLSHLGKAPEGRTTTTIDKEGGSVVASSFRFQGSVTFTVERRDDFKRVEVTIDRR